MADAADLAGSFIDAQLSSALARSQLPQHVANCPECEDCGEEIPAARRHAAPWAVTCAECQGIRESQARHRR